MPTVQCPRCMEFNLERAPDGCEGGYICEGFQRCDRGTGCHVLVSEEEFAELLATYRELDAEPTDSSDFVAETVAASDLNEDKDSMFVDVDGQNTTNSPGQAGGLKRKHKRLKSSDEDGTDSKDVEESDSSGEQNYAPSDSECPEMEENEVFDSLPAQSTDVRHALDKLSIRREPACGLLSLSEVDLVLKGAFKAPRGSDSRQLRGLAREEGSQDNRKKRLGARLPFSAFNIKPGSTLKEILKPEPPKLVDPEFSEDDLNLEALVLYEQTAQAATAEPCAETEAPPEGSAAAEAPKEFQHKFVGPNERVLDKYRKLKGLPAHCVVVEPFLCRFLREHQRQGVQFLFDCVTGRRGFEGFGCILADDMGLGKTFQSITLLWTLLTQGINGKPTIKRAAVVCPTSLVKNWAKEIEKWLGDRLEGGVIALSETSREDVVEACNKYTMKGVYQREQKFPPVLIISYETFRIHVDRFKVNGPELLICDEAHSMQLRKRRILNSGDFPAATIDAESTDRLKNDKTITNKALASLPCLRRVLLSGTPMQNDLEEFYAMVDFANPGLLGAPNNFRKSFQNPILAGREPDATESQREKGNTAQGNLSALVNHFILRRTNELLSKHLPPKVVQVVCCSMSQLQIDVYKTICQSKEVAKLCKGGGGSKKGVLASITALKKLCNHPKLIFDAIRASNNTGQPGDGGGLEECFHLFPPEFHQSRGKQEPLSSLSGKLHVLEKMLHILYHEKKERIVLISNYTQTIDLFQNICRFYGYPFVRLDGGTSIKKRQKLVDEFNDPTRHQFAFLLSSKAGGCGLNLVGASRLVLFDPDWNPANDKQAAARIWRDGQKRLVYEYRFFCTGSIEEKVYQRQLSKEGLQGGLFESELQMQSISTEDLRDLFKLREDTVSDTFDSLGLEGETSATQNGFPGMEELEKWGHHKGVETLEDDVLKRAGEGTVSFVFSCAVEGNRDKLTIPPR